METQQQQSGKIHAAICKIMAEVGGVAKTRSNEQQHYRFRGIADVYLACQPVMAANGVHVVPVEIVSQEMREGTSKNGGVTYHVFQRTRFHAYADDGSFVQIEAIGEAIDSGDKAANKAASAAMKYALVQLFALPEEDPDIDTENSSPEVKAGKPAQKDAPKAAPPKATATVKDLLARLAVLKITGKDAVLAWIATGVGRPIAATKELTSAEISELLATANKIQPSEKAA